MASRKMKTIALFTVLIVALLLLGFYGSPKEGFQSGSEDATFTLYYADWCPHCKSIKPEFSSFSNNGSGTIKINGKVVGLHMVEADKDAEKAKGKPVKGYPTFLLEKNGQFTEFSGERNAAGWKKFLEDNM
jgi:thiol-disulfide isomerase/thioredoxin